MTKGTHNEAAYGNAAFIPNAFGTVGNMIPSIALGYATGGAGELLGGGSMAAAGTTANLLQQAGSFGALGLGAAGQSMDEALANGATYNQAQAYGALSGATEVGTEMIGGETINSLFGRYGKSALGKVFGKVVDELNIENKVAKFLLNQVGQVGSEMTEEMISEALNPIWKAITYNPDALPKNIEEIGEYLKNIIHAGVEAIPSTILMQGGGLIMQGRNMSTVENAMINSINNSELDTETKQTLINEVQQANTEVRSEEALQNGIKPIADKVKVLEETEKITIPESTQKVLQFLQDTRPGLNIEFDSTIQGNGTHSTSNADGTRTITMNPNSKNAIEVIATHELAHDLKAGDLKSYQALQKAVLDYAEKIPQYKEALQSLDKTYKEGKVN